MGRRNLLVGGTGADRFMFTDGAEQSSGVGRDLIVDQNGVEGYQVGEDLVIELAGAALPAGLGWMVP